VDATPILAVPWPHDLDPATVPFTKRTITVLRRQGIYTNPVILNDVTTVGVLGWWNAGPVTVEDIRATGNDAIIRHHAETDLLSQLATDLSEMASEPWARHVWWRDPPLLPIRPEE
jgi:hypothetical protein